MDGRYLEFHKCLSNSNYLINVALVEDLNNIDAVRHLIIQNRLGVTLINATMIMDTFQLLVAVNKAVNARTKGSMTTKTIHSEILYSLSPSNSISGSLKQFGLSDTVKAYYIVEVIPSDECSKIESVFQIIDGRLSDVHSSRHAHVDEIRKVYKVSEEELIESSLLDAVVNRIACKDCM